MDRVFEECVTASGLADLPLPAVLRINSLADEFEFAWQSGQRPHIDDFVNGANQRERVALLHQLIPLDADYRRLAGESPLLDDYVSQFPGLDRTLLARYIGDEGDQSPPPAENFGSVQIALTQIPRRFGKYELLSEAGRGGMGVVFRARHRGLNRIVALKMILAGRLADAAHVERFYTEARAAARLQHPNIVPVYEAGEHEGQHFLAMACVDGSDLGELVRDGPLPAAQAATLIQAVAEAVHYAHGQGVIHRDLKPQNILIDRDGRPQITDFGLARDARAGGAATTTGMVLGTPNYMAPEQIAGRPESIGPAADVYSLGATLYHLLTGQPPFRAAGTIETLNNLIGREPASPRSLNPAIPNDLETICLACLRKNPQRRYQSACGLARDLERWLRCEPIRARHVTRLEKVWLWCRRKPAVASLIVTLAAVFLGAIAVGVEAYWRHRTESLVAKLLSADAAEVPAIVRQLASYSGRAGPLLHEAFADAEASGDAKKQLSAALALREFERGQGDFLRDRAVTIFEVADKLARRGQWHDAARALDHAIALYPDDLGWLHRSAILRLHLGDVDGYTQRCREMLVRDGRTDQSVIAHQIAHVVLLVTKPVGEPEELLQLAKVAVRSGQSAHVRTLATVHFRQGRYDEAKKLLERAVKTYAGYGKAMTLYFLAMTHHQLGEADAARHRLQEANQLFDQAAAWTKDGKYGTSWRRWITVAIVRREAEALTGAANEPLGMHGRKGNDAGRD
jgi:tetratricopeptide (TPR) repeat protein/predicted Ser/Thr protein kinase